MGRYDYGSADGPNFLQNIALNKQTNKTKGTEGQEAEEKNERRGKMFESLDPAMPEVNIILKFSTAQITKSYFLFKLI